MRRTSPQIEKGRYLVVAADCAGCHTVPDGGKPFAGGGRSRRRSATSLRRTSRRTARPASARGATTDFDNAVRKGIRPDGARLYPAMPYTAYTKMSRNDVLAIRAYLNTIEPVRNSVGRQHVAVPVQHPRRDAGMELALFHAGRIQARSAKVRRMESRRVPGAGPGHCGACHTPKTFLGGDKTSEYLQRFGTCRAGSRPTSPMTSARARRLVSGGHRAYLKTGHNRITAATGPMAEEITLVELAHDRQRPHAIATYLKSLPGAQEHSAAVAERSGHGRRTGRSTAINVRLAMGWMGMVCRSFFHRSPILRWFAQATRAR